MNELLGPGIRILPARSSSQTASKEMPIVQSTYAEGYQGLQNLIEAPVIDSKGQSPDLQIAWLRGAATQIIRKTALSHLPLDHPPSAKDEGTDQLDGSYQNLVYPFWYGILVLVVFIALGWTERSVGHTYTEQEE